MDGGVCLQRKPLAAAKGSGPEGRGPGFWCCWGVAERGRGKTKVRGRSRASWATPEPSLRKPGISSIAHDKQAFHDQIGRLLSWPPQPPVSGDAEGWWEVPI